MEMRPLQSTEAAFNDEDTRLLEQCANQIAIAVENALAYHELEAVKNKLAQEKVYLEDEIRDEFNFEEIIGCGGGGRPALHRTLYATLLSRHPA